MVPQRVSVLLLTVLLLALIFLGTGQAKTSSVPELPWPELTARLSKLPPSCAICQKLKKRDGPVSDKVKFFYADKSAAVIPPVPAGDGGNLMHVSLVAPGKINKVIWTCIGNTCPWTYGCIPQTCGGHQDVEYHGDSTADWWAWTNDGNNSQYVFEVHYQG
jgi:hypothetical protein